MYSLDLSTPSRNHQTNNASARIATTQNQGKALHSPSHLPTPFQDGLLMAMMMMGLSLLLSRHGGLGVGGSTGLSSSRSFGRSSGSRGGSLSSGSLRGFRLSGRLGSSVSSRLGCLDSRGCFSRSDSRSGGSSSSTGSSRSVSLRCLGGSTSGLALLGFLVLLAKGGLQLALDVGECVQRNSTHFVSIYESFLAASRLSLFDKGFELRRGRRG
ncbi:hypothetical protein F5Y10DRAFT_238491 [Nemania abortiva]|nr:hypothetical protein F5Y10DRAFT_238491 [Nemania abortiva]